jgi:lipoate-protein ligase A
MPKPWRYIEDDGLDAARGLAADELLWRQAGQAGRPPALRLYTYRSWCALVGRFQDLEAELDLDVCQRLSIEVNRRPTGGGAIVMGSGQLGLALTGRLGEDVFPSKPGSLFEVLSQGVVEGLKALGLEARFRPRNDIEVEGLKIAGVGCVVDDQGTVLFHTSILLDLDLELFSQVLKLPRQALAERLTSVEALMPGVSLAEARDALRRGFESSFGVATWLEGWSVEELKAIEDIVQETYGTSGWVFQPFERPRAQGRWQGRTPAGELTVEVSLEGRLFRHVWIGGDLFGCDRALRRLEAALKGQRADEASVGRALKATWQEGALLGMGPEDLARAVLDAVAAAEGLEVP